MKTTIDQHAHDTFSRWARVGLLALVMVAVAGCGEVDSGDGQVRNSVALPTDSVLTLFCEDAGIANEPCILNDPDNPYALTPIDDTNKFTLHDAAPSNKARFYLWATAQAMSPRGENQFYLAEALHGMFSESGSLLARQQTLKAYRSILDNYFNSVTFRDLNSGTGVQQPVPVRELVGENMYAPRAELNSLFNNRVEALRQFGEWGYTYDAFDATSNPDGTNDFTRNF